MRLIKLGSIPEGDGLDPYMHNNEYQRKELSDASMRIVVGISKNQLLLIRDLASVLEPPFRLLYVLIVPRTRRDEDAGRYEAPDEFDRDELSAFLKRYETLFEQDGRHALWIMSDSGQIVFTPHDLIYMYGPIALFESVLLTRGYIEGTFKMPQLQHMHYYHELFDPVVDDLLASRAWIKYPLTEMDDET